MLFLNIVIATSYLFLQKKKEQELHAALVRSAPAEVTQYFTAASEHHC